MAAQIPIKDNQEANHKALMMVRQDKEREAGDGHDGTWVAHPGLVSLANEVFDEMMPTPNQITKQMPDYNPTAADLLAIPEGSRTEAGLRHSINVSLGYLEAWLRGTGCVPLYNLMEDAATAEISRSQMWQWCRHEAELDDGRKVTPTLIDQIIHEEAERWEQEVAHTYQNRLELASELLKEMTHAEEMPDFLTLRAYDKIVEEGK
jgi:malate synthase